MTDPRTELIEIYGSHLVKDVGDLAEYRALCTRNWTSRAFHGERSQIEKVKSYLEESVGREASYRGEVKRAIKALFKFRREGKQEACRALIERAYLGSWGDSQKAYFREIADLLRDYADYFLSFTSRNPNECQRDENTINLAYKHFIKSAIGDTSYEDADRVKENLLARAIRHLLNDERRLDGFYYPAHEGDSTVVREKLEKACRRALVLVQLVQNQMFLSGPGETNFCHFEYVKSRAAVEAGHFVVVLAAPSRSDLVARDDVEVANPDPEFISWYDAVEARDPVTLAYTRSHVPEQIDALHRTLKEKVVDRILEIRNALCEKVPV